MSDQAIDPNAEPDLYEYSCDIDSALEAAGENMIPDSEVRARHRAGFSPRMAAFVSIVGLSGCQAALPGDTRPVRAWRAELDRALAGMKHTPATDADITDAVQSDDDLRADLEPFANAAMLAITIATRRGMVDTLAAGESTAESTPAVSNDAAPVEFPWIARAKLPYGGFDAGESTGFRTWREAADFLRDLFSARPEKDYAAGVAAIQALKLDQPVLLVGAGWTLEIRNAASTTNTPETRVAAPADEPGNLFGAVTTGDGNAATGIDAMRHAQAMTNSAAPADIVTRLEDWLAMAKPGFTFPLEREDASELLRRVEAGADPAPKPRGRPRSDSVEEAIDLLMRPNGATSLEIQQVRGWSSAPALSHIKQMAEKFPDRMSGKEIIYLGGKAGGKRFAIRDVAVR